MECPKEQVLSHCLEHEKQQYWPQHTGEALAAQNLPQNGLEKKQWNTAKVAQIDEKLLAYTKQLWHDRSLALYYEEV